MAASSGEIVLVLLVTDLGARCRRSFDCMRSACDCSILSKTQPGGGHRSTKSLLLANNN